MMSALFSTDVMFCPRGLKNYNTVTGSGPTVITVNSGKCISLNETPQTPKKTAPGTWETPYPKILQGGAVENFRPQEVSERVTHAEPLSPPNEQEAPAVTPAHQENEDFLNVHVETPKESPAVESPVSYQVESGSGSEPISKQEGSHHLYTSSTLTPEPVRATEEPRGFSHESDEDVYFQQPVEQEHLEEQPHAPADAWLKKGSVAEEEHEETSDSETEAVCEPTFASRTSSPASDSEPEESVTDQRLDFRQDDEIPNDGAAKSEREGTISSQIGTEETDAEDKLYPDGEEMDTWDSVIERKVHVERDDGSTKDEEKGQHAEPEEDISGTEPAREKRDVRKEIGTEAQECDDVATAVMDTQEDDEDEQRVTLDRDSALLSDEEEDSQNVSVSWRTELESDSYAQENTLADTRPLIRYKSDETDANASHMDESESSDAEQEKKVGEAGTWSEGKSKRFGTMEDLCEEAEGEALDEEYDLDGPGLTTSVCATSVTETENAEDIVEEVDERHSEDETEEASKPSASRNVDYHEELETDRLVEQELESLCTDSYSAHFAQRQDRRRAGVSVEEGTEGEEAEQTEPEATFFCADPPLRVIIDDSSDSSVTVPQTEAQLEAQKATDVPEKREFEGEQDVSMVTHADETEDGLMRNPSSSEEPNSEQQAAAPTEEQEVGPVDVEHVVEDVEDCQSVRDADAAEWEVLQNPSEGFDIGDETESAGLYRHDKNSSDEDAVTHREESLEISPDSVPDENDIFVVKDSEELLDKSGRDNELHDVFSSDRRTDFWVSSLGTGATYQADDPYSEAVGQTNQNVGFSDSLVWGTLENTNELNRNSGLGSHRALDAEGGQGQARSAVKQLCRTDDSEESEAEGESWSSGEEAATRLS